MTSPAPHRPTSPRAVVSAAPRRGSCRRCCTQTRPTHLPTRLPLRPQHHKAALQHNHKHWQRRPPLHQLLLLLEALVPRPQGPNRLRCPRSPRARRLQRMQLPSKRPVRSVRRLCPQARHQQTRVAYVMTTNTASGRSAISRWVVLCCHRIVCLRC
jgi:hypothetical protein